MQSASRHLHINTYISQFFNSSTSHLSLKPLLRDKITPRFSTNEYLTGTFYDIPLTLKEAYVISLDWLLTTAGIHFSSLHIRIDVSISYPYQCVEFHP